MAFDGVNHQNVLFGGMDGIMMDPPFGETWLWDGAAGTWTEPFTPGPAPRTFAAMAFDGASSHVLLFGGVTDYFGIALWGDTWAWDGAARTWTLVTQSGPPARKGAAMVYDGARAKVVLFGGFDDNTTWFDDTWEWDGAMGSWTPLMAVGPSARELFAMAYDATRGVTVLFGGSGPGNPYLADTWEWDGATATWTLRSSSGPSGRNGASMVHDTARGRVVLFGGFTANGATAEAWEWDGVAGAWTQLSSTGPSARQSASMSYDEVRQRGVLFGGADVSSAALGDTWELALVEVDGGIDDAGPVDASGGSDAGVDSSIGIDAAVMDATTVDADIDSSVSVDAGFDASSDSDATSDSGQPVIDATADTGVGPVDASGDARAMIDGDVAIDAASMDSGMTSNARDGGESAPPSEDGGCGCKIVRSTSSPTNVTGLFACAAIATSLFARRRLRRREDLRLRRRTACRCREDQDLILKTTFS
jgi:hypothetical protein